MNKDDTIKKLQKDIEYYNNLIENIMTELMKVDTSNSEFLQELKEDYLQAEKILDEIK